MKIVQRLIGCILLLVSFSSVTGIYACSCAGWPTSCAAFDAAEVVFIGSVRTVEDKKARADDGREFITSQKAYVQVEKTFKGSLATEVIFRSYGSSCDVEYKEGQRWLFYTSYKQKEKAFAIGGCGRSGLIENASEDLLYLQGLPKTAGRTRISGTLRHYEDDPEEGFSLVRNILGAKITVIGAGKTYETYTDKNGAYEIYDLPPGSYVVRPEIPLGLKVQFPMFNGPRSITSLGSAGEAALELKEKSCVGVSFVLSADTQITGKVIGADGKNLPDVCLRLVPVDKKVGPYFFHFNCTKSDGSYHFEEFPPGQYFIVANDDAEISSSSPFPLLYYPGVIDKDKAIKVSVTAGDRLADYNIHVPAQSPIYVISGVVTTSDGKPFADASVEFEAAEERAGYDLDAQTSTDSQGRFALKVLPGLKGAIKAFSYTYVGEYEKCPELDRLLKEAKDSQVETKSLPVEVNSDLSGIKLVFPFPHCEKRKSE